MTWLADRMIQAGICTSPGGCLWELTTHPVVAVIISILLTAGIVQCVAARYQRRSKIREFQFQTLKETIEHHRRLADAGGAFYAAKAEFLVGAKLNLTNDETSRRRDVLVASAMALDTAIKGAEASVVMHRVLYGKATRGLWRGVLNLFTDVMLLDDPFVMEARIDRAAQEHARFVAAVAKEIYLPNSYLDLAEDRRSQARREQVRGILEAVGVRPQNEKERQG